MGFFATFVSGCAKESGSAAPRNCAPEELPANSSPANGSARVFSPDPMVGSGLTDLSPTSVKLDSFAINASLERLDGHGVLKGKYVEVVNGTTCQGWFGAYDLNGAFSYPHSDSRFQEAMSYFWGDQFRHSLFTADQLLPATAVTVLAHCGNEDNAFYFRNQETGARVVCLGDSVATPGAFYSDDASVIVHELQHATTTETYSPVQRLNRFWYDEAGSLNEAVSDFMTLVFEEPFITASFDPKLFSRWALGSFIPQHVGSRGAHRCPSYDPSYPACGTYPAFSASNNTVSYIYPDGMGWPHSNNFQGPGYVANAFGTYKAQEEIHNAAVLLEGALWDVYEAIKLNHGGDQEQAKLLSFKLVMESIKHLDRPTSTNLSPVTYRGLADQMVLYAPEVGLTSADQASMVAALTSRGLLGGTLLDANWAAVGPGNAGVTAGLRIQDNPSLLKSWLIQMTENVNAGSEVPQGISTGLNSQLDPGELVAIWFDIQNVAAQSAGAVHLTVTALDPEVTFDPNVNIGIVAGQNVSAQMLYGKVNGTSIVTALTSANPTFHVATGNNYFRTNPFFDRNWSTAFWVRVSATAAHGATVRFQVQAKPSNGAASTITFSTVIN